MVRKKSTGQAVNTVKRVAIKQVPGWNEQAMLNSIDAKFKQIVNPNSQHQKRSCNRVWISYDGWITLVIKA